jgi:Ca2+-binding RTX toxin-like protein
MAVLTVEQELLLDTALLTSGLVDLLLTPIGGRTVLYALSRADGLLFELDVANDGTVTVVNTLALSGTFIAGSDPVLTYQTRLDGSAALILSGMPETYGQSVDLDATGSLGTQMQLSGLGTLASPSSLFVDGTNVLVSGGVASLNLYADTGSGYVWSASLNDTVDSYLADVSASVTFSLGAQTFIGTASALENGVNLARVTNAGLSQAGALGPAEYLPIGTPQDMDVVQRFGETHLVLASSGSSSLTTISVASGGVPLLSDHILDDATTAIGGARTLDTVRQGSLVYVASGGDEGGVSLFTMLPGGRLVHLDTLADDNFLSLERVTSVELSVAGSALQIFVASVLADDITRLSFDISAQGTVVFADGAGGGAFGTQLNDQVIGTDVSEALSGDAGDDILLDGSGVDTLTGGPGADLFVFAADGVTDLVTDFERGIDKLDLSAFDFLYSIDQLTLTPELDGATLTHGNETVRVFTSDGAPLTLEDLSTEDILNVDRPPFLATAQELSGGAGPDTLTGGFGNDTIRGAEGDDELIGNGGNDSLEGGIGADQIDGGVGEDTLRGQEDGDTLAGGNGSDIIFGDGGDDLIYGDDYDWSGA